MTRTTLAIDDDLLKRIKEKAVREGRTLQGVANDLLRQALVQQRPASKRRLSLRAGGRQLSNPVWISSIGTSSSLIVGREGLAFEAFQ